MTKARKVNVAKAIEIFAELELQGIVGHAELKAFNAPSECGQLLVDVWTQARTQAEKAAGCTEKELETLCRKIGFNYHRVSAKVLEKKMAESEWF